MLGSMAGRVVTRAVTSPSGRMSPSWAPWNAARS